MSLHIPLNKRKLPRIKRQESEVQSLTKEETKFNNPDNRIPEDLNEHNNTSNDNDQNNSNNNRNVLNNRNNEFNNQEEDQDELIRKRRREELQRLIEEEELKKQQDHHFKNVPEFIRKGENEQAIISYMRMKQRNFTDGALDITVEPEDIENENIELYDNKCINLEPAEVAYDKDIVPKYFIESFSRDKFYKLDRDPDITEEDSLADTTAVTEKDYHTQHRKSDIYGKEIKDKEPYKRKKDKEDLLEDEIATTIFRISNNVSIFFLFAQGLLAGMSLMSILLLYQYNSYSNFILVFSDIIKNVFNLTHCLTFGSIVGNGIKLVTTHRFYEKITNEYFFNRVKKEKIKVKLYVLHIAFWLFVIAFIIELTMATYIQKIVYSSHTSSINSDLLTQSKFDTFKTLYLVVDILVIIVFIINIFDISKVSDLEYEANN